MFSTYRGGMGKEMGGKFKREDAAAAAKSLQLCPTLCDPIDDSPPGSSVVSRKCKLKQIHTY